MVDWGVKRQNKQNKARKLIVESENNQAFCHLTIMSTLIKRNRAHSFQLKYTAKASILQNIFILNSAEHEMIAAHKYLIA